MQPYIQKWSFLYQIETVPVPVESWKESYTKLHVTKPYIALKEEIYITLRHQELRNCKNICYESHCEKLCKAKHKTKIHLCKCYLLQFQSSDH